MPDNEKCNHEWCYDKDWRDWLRVENEIVRIPQHCDKCGMLSDEIRLYSCVTDRETGETIA